MFDGKYFDWNQKRIKGVVDFYGYKFFYFKKLLDLGCGYGDLGGVLYRLGSDVTAVDARQEHLKVLSKKYTGVKTVQANLDAAWPFHGQKFDLILDLGLLCHLSDYEKHLQQVCASTTHLVLETAVCDSDDPQKVIMVDEDRAVYDLAYNGRGCRPSPAAIERVLRENGMNFKRLDNAKFNSGEFTYDWYPRNDNSTNLSKRKIWFAVKESSPIQFANPNSEISYPPVNIPAPASQGYVTPIINSATPIHASPKPPMTARMEAEARARVEATTATYRQALTWPEPSPIRNHYKALPLNEQVRKDSKTFALVTPDDYRSTTNSDFRAVISPNTYSSKMWYKKIAPLFPQFRLSKNVLSMPGFAKSDAIPDIVMCSLDNLQAHSRVWIDEWTKPGLTDQHIEILKSCHAIITPSLLNAQEIWKYLPHANVFRISKPWPAIEVQPASGDYFLYFEKSPILTDQLLQSWDPSWGNLTVVGSTIKLPSFATYISDGEPYPQIMSLVLGAKAIIDLSENNYYKSGIIQLSQNLNLPMISNNHTKLSDNVSNYYMVQQDKRVSPNPTALDIRWAIGKFLNEKTPTKANTGGVRAHNDNFLVDEVRRIMGVK